MKRTVIAVATIAAALSISTTSFAQSKQGMQNGRHLGWYKQDKKKHDKWDKRDDRRDDRYDQNRRNDDRWDNDRYDNNRYDNGRYDNSRYDNSRYDNSRYDSNRYDSRYGNGYGSQSTYQRREETKNEWKNIAMAGGAVALIGLLQKDNRLVFGGAAGALYSLYRYEQDRKSQSSLDRARARYFDNDYFTRDGVRYDRKLVTQNGQRYYQFVRAR